MNSDFTGLLSRSGIEETHDRIAPFIHRTPVLTSTAINGMVGGQVFFKGENLQKVGAFKIRGASNAAALLADSERARGLATHSSGNHAQAVARAAQRLGVPAFIVMPRNAPAVKRAAVEGYGATVIESGPTIADREETMEGVLSETKAAFIHPYDDERVISGQATAARELLQEYPDLDVLMAPVGGGGLMSGTCLAARYFGRRGNAIRSFGCEPAGADDAARSFAAGHRLTNTTVDTIADGLRTNLSDRTFAILRDHLEEIITVTDEQIGRAMRLIYERLKTVVEPSAAVPLAALMSRREHFGNRRIGIILSGGNVDFQQIDLSRW
jgi:threonine dehydratase